MLDNPQNILIDGRLRALQTEPYTQKEAEAAVGLRTDNGTKHATRSEDTPNEVTAMGHKDTDDAR